MAELLKVVYSEKFGLQNGSLEKKMIVSYNINETNPEFEIPLSGSHFIKNSAVVWFQEWSWSSQGSYPAG